MPKHWTYLAILPCLALAACTLTAPFSEGPSDPPQPGVTPTQGVEYTAPPSSQSPLAAPAEPSSLLVTPDATLIPPTLADTPVPFDGGDGHETTLVQPISLNQPQTASLLGRFEAHNWLFSGMAGQTITVRVEAAPGTTTDPRLKVIDPDGRIIAENDDVSLGTATATPGPDGSAGVIERGAVLTFTLLVDGIYTLRVDVYSPGDYVITVSEG